MTDYTVTVLSKYHEKARPDLESWNRLLLDLWRWGCGSVGEACLACPGSIPSMERASMAGAHVFPPLGRQAQEDQTFTVILDCRPA